MFFGVIVSMVVGASSMDVPIYVIWCGATSLLIAGAAASYFYRPKVEATRILPKHVCAGEQIKYEVRLQSRSRGRTNDIEVVEAQLPPGLKAVAPESARIKALPAGAEHAVTLGLDCPKRGIYSLDALSVFSTFPSGLVKMRRGTGPSQSLMVYPYFKRLGYFPLPLGRRYQPGGLAMTSDVGDSTEFLCTREYRYGDSIRDIHWPSWARTGKPVVKVFQEEYFVRLAMLLDSEVRDGDDRAFEAGISLAASVADVLSRHEYIIDIFAAGEKIYRFQAGRALAYFDNVLQILACITHAPRVEMKSVLGSLLFEANGLSALVCILMDWDEERKALIRTLRSSGVATKTIIVREEKPSLDFAGEPEVHWWKPDEVLDAFK